MSSIVDGTITDSHVVADTTRALCRLYSFLHRTVIGETLCGRPIEALSIGHGEQAILFTAGMRAQESVTAALCLRLCEELCRITQGEHRSPTFDVAAALPTRTVVLIPMLNPDGVDIALHGSRAGGSHSDLLHAHGADIKGYWQANAIGVEPFLNFDADRFALQQQQREHGITGPFGRGFGGSSPESEAETRALIGLCRRMSFSHTVSLTCGDGTVRWYHGDNTPPHAHMTARFLANAARLLPADTNITVYGGFSAWFINTFSRPAFDLVLPPSIHRTSDTMYAAVRNALLLATVL